MRTYQLTVIAIALATMSTPVRAETGVPAGVVGGNPGAPTIDMFSVSNLNSVTGSAATIALSVQPDAAVTAWMNFINKWLSHRPLSPWGPRTLPVLAPSPVVTTTPEPASLVLMSTGMIALLAFARSRENA